MSDLEEHSEELSQTRHLRSFVIQKLNEIFELSIMEEIW